jgi:PAS domain S-box-containing protein
MKNSQPSPALAGGATSTATIETPDMFRQLLESAPDTIVVVDNKGQILLTNSMTEKTFGYQQEGLIGQPIEILIPERFQHSHVAHRQNYFTKPNTRPMGSNLELTARRKDGSEFPTEISISPLNTPQGVLVMAVVRDISDRKQAQQELQRHAKELERSNAELEQFAYVASHDLQEPLRIVASYSQLLARRYQDKLDADANEFIDFIVDGASRMQGLINDLLSYSRVGSRGQEFEATDLNEVIESTLHILELGIQDNAATVTHDNMPTLMVDKSQMGQLFQNLISNAIKFHGDSPPQIHLGVEQQAEEFVFTVRDNGIGIDPQYAERIFLVFQRLHGKKEYPGTGIGLAICKKIVERHGGRIWMESSPGEGSTFYFTIPLNAQEFE